MMSDKLGDTQAASTDDSAHYWGFVFQQNKRPTDKFERLLKGIATCIVSFTPPPPRCAYVVTMFVKLIDTTTEQ